MSVIDDYLKNVAPAQRAELERIRKIVKQVVPEAVEVISYAMPGFKYQKKYLITFAAFKDHMSIFPGAEPTETLKAKLSKYKLSKGTIQFTLDNPIHESIIKEILDIRVKSISKK